MKPGIDYVGVTISFYCNDGKGKFLFHKRSKNCRDEVGRWDCGGGQLEFGEDPIDGVLREVREEYGCKGIIQEQLPAHSIIRFQNKIKTHWLAIPFFIKVNPKDVKNNEPNKIDEIKWFRLNNLPTPLHTGFKYSNKRYSDYFKKYR
ncbi:MAG: RNA pyrophosphohydrolase [Candidatus Levybacteria bacterium CG_4_10_14_0_2_um_filter_36_16]|nr:MAG: hypothetical protein AUK12_01465 [Candidatus Levybacteria bacterium CG2_30_37_29]PIR79426.1 MAG: RNA pyrophosphohydrolase [Candidatus Levybacteria bacterium CG10_big_fil_rev_8_21_14_0_10_36_30]PIZ97827.1 MAG: RNA pyrophosphohydrolase [Candidatus Levybacteria bacterium CG_4_10_14_0_2_um_filter_36_16]PJA90507.1 MAG: RNA pyrophosphohydrolase [Candidatus Levybacteria bacterium CG_4_9_14_3_um_filter_36_7]